MTGGARGIRGMEQLNTGDIAYAFTGAGRVVATPRLPSFALVGRGL